MKDSNMRALGAMKKGAILSADGRYRYELSRIWDESKYTARFVMLNPSTADAAQNDPTVRKCIGFAVLWGYGGIRIMNLFGLRSKEPHRLLNVADPVGPENNEYLKRFCYEARKQAGGIICAWGANGHWLARDAAFVRMAVRTELVALRLTQSGAPEHPLYVPYEARVVPFGRS